jgi:GT2 family glycosyltransferase
VLLSRRFLDDVGGFDVRFFLYAEDADLSWRGRLRGWRYCYEPRSVVRHEHSATVGGRSSLATHLARRNRLLLLVKCAPASLARAAVLDLLREIGRAAQRDVLRRLVTFRRPVPAHLVASGRVLVGWARMAPRTLIQRRALQRQALRPQAS